MGLVEYNLSSEDESCDPDENSPVFTLKEITSETKVSKNLINYNDVSITKNNISKGVYQKIQNLRQKILKPKDKSFSLNLNEQLDSSSDSDDNSRSSIKEKIYKKSNQNTKDLLSLLPPTQGFIVREGVKPILIPQQISRPRQNENSDSKVSDIIKVKDDFKIEPSNFFSFYNARDEEQRLEKVTQDVESSPVSEKPILMTYRQEFVNQSDEYINKFPQPQISEEITATFEKKSYDINRLKPGQRLLADDTDLIPEPQIEEEGQWNEETFIPAPERKRARLARDKAIGKVDIETIMASSSVREVSQEHLTAGSKVELMKSVTADSQQYRGSASSEFQASKLATRKHQITWLAQRATDEEFELKERWARQKQNQATNRAKYGF